MIGQDNSIVGRVVKIILFITVLLFNYDIIASVFGVLRGGGGAGGCPVIIIILLSH